MMEPHYANIFAYRLKTARKAKGLTQARLGVLAGIDENSASARMNQYERGKHVPDFLMMNNIAKVLDIPMAYFFIQDNVFAELVIAIYRLSPVEQENLLKNITSTSDK